MSAPFVYAHAQGAGWSDIGAACARQLQPLAAEANLGFVYMTDALARDADKLLAVLRSETGIAQWVGCAGVGICATGQEYYEQPAAALMVGAFPPGSFEVFSGLKGPLVAKPTEAFEPNVALVHVDPATPGVYAAVAGLSGHLRTGFLFGGLSSSRGNEVQIANGVTTGALSGVCFSEQVNITTRLTQGCTPVGAQHVITNCDQNIIITIDDQQALDVLHQDTNHALARNLSRVPGYIFAGFPIAGSDTDDYVVRNLVGIDPVQGMIAVGELVEPGMKIMFCRRDMGSAREDLLRMLHSAKQALKQPLRGGLYVSCLWRGAHTFGPHSAELRAIAQELGEFPLVGFFANGEICHNRLYGYTGVLTLFV